MALAPTRARAISKKLLASTLWTEQEDLLLEKLMNENPLIDGEELCKHFSGKSVKQILDRWSKVLDPKMVKGSWTREEDEIIMQFVAEVGAKNWATLAEKLPGRVGKQCRERWVNHLNPNLNKDPWTVEEDQQLINLHATMGNCWTKIASFFPGRTDNNIKNRWNTTLKKRLERLEKGQPLIMKKGRKPKQMKAPQQLDIQPHSHLVNEASSPPSEPYSVDEMLVKGIKMETFTGPIASFIAFIPDPRFQVELKYNYSVTQNRLAFQSLLSQVNQ